MKTERHKITKPAQRHKYNTKQYEYTKAKPLNRHDKNNVVGKNQYRPKRGGGKH